MGQIIAPRGPWKNVAKLFDPSRKIFEGAYTVRLYKDAIEVKAKCVHCQSRIEFVYKMTQAQGRDMERDAQYRKNIVSHCADRVQEEHQCGLMFAGRDTVEDLHRLLEKESRK